MNYSVRFITKAAVIAALYAVVTIILAPISFGLVQFRISEAFMMISAFTPAAIPGLFVGCVISNIYGGFGIIDIAFGSLATLLAAAMTYYLSRQFLRRQVNTTVIKARVIERTKPFLLPLPTIIFNGLIVGAYLPFVVPEIRNMAANFFVVLFMSIGSVALGETIVTFAIGIPLYFGLKRTPIFRDETEEIYNRKGRYDR